MFFLMLCSTSGGYLPSTPLKGRLQRWRAVMAVWMHEIFWSNQRQVLRPVECQLQGSATSTGNTRLTALDRHRSFKRGMCWQLMVDRWVLWTTLALLCPRPPETQRPWVRQEGNPPLLEGGSTYTSPVEIFLADALATMHSHGR